MRLCPHCGEKRVVMVTANPPWTDDHWQCEACDSTYADKAHYNRERAKRYREDRGPIDCRSPNLAANMRKYRYGLTDEQYAQLLADQGGKCAVCNDGMDRPCVDHCHSTNKVRGIVCPRCNIMLGFIEKYGELLPKLQEYLRQTEE